MKFNILKYRNDIKINIIFTCHSFKMIDFSHISQAPQIHVGIASTYIISIL